MSADTSELEAFALDLGNVSARLIPGVRGVVSRGALNIKNQLRREALQSTHFKQLEQAIGYDLVVGEWSGDASIEASIGPQKERDMSAGLLGAYFGWSRGGGGTLPDPILALQAEEPRFLEGIAKAVGFVFDD